MPSCAPRPVPTISAVGVASPSAHGQAMTSTATAAGNAARRIDEQPGDQRQQRDPDDDRYEHGRHPVGQPLHRGLAGLGLLDQPGQLGQLGVGADAGGPDDQSAAGVHGAADDRVARPDLDRDRLAGEHARVDRGRAVDDLAVGGDLLAGTDDEPVADRERRRPGFASRRRPGAPRRPWRRAAAAPAARHRSDASPAPRRTARQAGRRSPPPRSPGRSCRSGRRARAASGIPRPCRPRPRCRRPARTRTRGRRRASPSRSACPSSRCRVAGWPTRLGGTAGQPRAPPAWRGRATPTASRRTAPPGPSTARSPAPRARPRRRAGAASRGSGPAPRAAGRSPCSRRPRRSRPGRPR